MRTFIALELPEEFAAECAYLSRQLSELIRGRVSKPSTHHVTLAFLGEVDDAEASRAIDALDSACAGRGAIRLSCEGLGTFGRGREKTLYLALSRTEELDGLAAAVRSELDARSLAFDRKAFVPHMTLARRAQLPQDLSALVFPAPDVASHVALLKSTLTADGPLYKKLYAVELQR